jgi:hypothetical protein
VPIYDTWFDPNRHGFAFANLFDFRLAFDVPWLGAIDLGSIVYGLCGGMCFAALDYWHAGIPVPTDANVRDLGRLYPWIWRRQIDSLTLPTGPLRVFQSMMRSDADLAGLATGREHHRLMRRLARAEPAVLLLVRGAGMADPTINHQVVAVRAEQRADATTLWLYDPNYPAEHPTMTIDGSGCVHSTGERDRGYYVLDYRPRRRGLPTL